MRSIPATPRSAARVYCTLILLMRSGEVCNRLVPYATSRVRNAVMLQTGHILIIDQERPIAAVLAELLTEAGYTAYTLYDSADALAVIAVVPPALIVLDVGEHMRPGSALITQIHAAGFGSIPIVVMSADLAATMPELHSPSVVECFAKPFDIDLLLACVARYVQPLAAEPALLALAAQS